MRRILTILFIFFFISGFLQTPSEKEIKTVAVNFYNYLQKANLTANDIKVEKKHFFRNTLTYITVVLNNNDWIIISSPMTFLGGSIGIKF